MQRHVALRRNQNASLDALRSDAVQRLHFALAKIGGTYRKIEEPLEEAGHRNQLTDSEQGWRKRGEEQSDTSHRYSAEAIPAHSRVQRGYARDYRTFMAFKRANDIDRK